MDMKPLLTVIIPVYNVAPHLDRCLQSVQSGGVEAMEVLLIDDASTDESLAICMKWIASDSRFHLLQHTANKGLSAARNTGLSHAQGQYVCFVDSDDYLDPYTLQHQIQLLSIHPEVSIVEYPVSVYEGAKSFHYNITFPEERLLTFSEWLAQDGCSHAYACNKVFKRELWNNIKFPLNEYFEDLHTIPSVIHSAGHIMQSPYGCYHYMYYSGTISRVIDRRHLEDLLRGQIRAYQLLQESLGEKHPATLYFYLQMCNIQISLLSQCGGDCVIPYRSVSLRRLCKHPKVSHIMLLKAFLNNLVGPKYMCLWAKMISRKR